MKHSPFWGSLSCFSQCVMVHYPAGESICTDDTWLWYQAFNENDRPIYKWGLNKNCKYNASNNGRKLGYQKGFTFLAHPVNQNHWTSDLNRQLIQELLPVFWSNWNTRNWNTYLKYILSVLCNLYFVFYAILECNMYLVFQLGPTVFSIGEIIYNENDIQFGAWLGFPQPFPSPF